MLLRYTTDNCTDREQEEDTYIQTDNRRRTATQVEDRRRTAQR
jgi:hypothetical protein